MEAAVETTTSSPLDRSAEAEQVNQSENPLTFTAKAVEMIRETMERESLQGWGIRIGVVGGGCSGFQYSLDFDKEAKDGDMQLAQDGIPFFMDAMSSMYLTGVSVDYVVGAQGAGFKFNNPGAKSTCGCGSSFSA